MKKLMSFVCLMTMIVMSVQAQLDQQKLNRMMRQFIPARMEKVNVQKRVQKSVDSVLSSFDKYLYSENAKKMLTYYNEDNEFLEAATTYEITANNKIIESGQVLNGDTISKKVYTYAETADNVIMDEYEAYSDMLQKTGTMIYYGVKNITFSALSKLIETMDMDFMICDSLQMITYDEDTTVAFGYFTFNTDGLPTKFVLGMDMAGMNVDFLINITYTGKLPTSLLVSLNAMGGVITADLLNLTLTYNGEGQLTTAEAIPIPNEMGLLDMERMKEVSSYVDKKLRCESTYAWNQIDSLNGEYVLTHRSYYTYYPTDGNVDTVFNYVFVYDSSESIASASRIEVVVSPNPVKDMLNISGQEETTEVSVFNTEGRLVLSTRVEAGEASISMQSLSKGMYFVKLQNTKGVSVQQVVKQ